jgi:hypothetical protein
MNKWKTIQLCVASSSLAFLGLHSALAGETIDLGNGASITLGAAVRTKVSLLYSNTDYRKFASTRLFRDLVNGG